MTPSVEEFATSDAVNWESDFIWVQETSLLEIVQKSEQTIKLRRNNGTQFSLPIDEMQMRYFEIRNGSFAKPRYRPVKAHVLSTDETLRVEGKDIVFPEGSAILHESGRFKIVEKDILMRDYEAVSYPSDESFPETPFSA